MNLPPEEDKGSEVMYFWAGCVFVFLFFVLVLGIGALFGGVKL